MERPDPPRIATTTLRDAGHRNRTRMRSHRREWCARVRNMMSTAATYRGRRETEQAKPTMCGPSPHPKASACINRTRPRPKTTKFRREARGQVQVPDAPNPSRCLHRRLLRGSCAEVLEALWLVEDEHAPPVPATPMAQWSETNLLPFISGIWG